MPKLVIVDGSSLIYRAFFALPSLTTADGTPTNAVYGLAGMLLKLLSEEKPDVFLAAMEAGRTFRHAEFADYKAHRPRTPDDLAVQAPICRALIQAFRIPILQHPGYEADDVIGVVTRRAREAGYEVLIVTGDMDALQLVEDGVRVMLTRRGVSDTELYDTSAVEERYGVPPGRLPEFKALKGDSSDNIPGVAGIGDKTAAQLLQEFPTLEALLAGAGGLRQNRVRENLLAAGEQVLLYRRLATIVTDLPLDTPFEQWRYQGPDTAALQKLFARLEFRTLAARIPGTGEPAPAAESDGPGDWRVVQDEAEAAEWAKTARACGWAALHAAGGRRQDGLRRLALSSGGQTILCGDDSGAEGGLFAGEGGSLPRSVSELLGDPEFGLAAHDLKEEFHRLRDAGLKGGRPAFDTLLAAYVLSPGRSSYRLGELAREHLGWPPGSGDRDETLAWTAAAVAALREPLQRRLEADDLAHVYTELELPLIPILLGMERLGVAIDRAHLARLSKRLAHRIAELEAEAGEAAGGTFNLGSPKQLQEVLFTRLGLPTGRRTKTGFSTDSDVLQDLALLHPLPGLVLEYRELSKLRSTYAEALPLLIDPHDGRVHTHLNQAVAATGRLSSSEPNLQNIPVRTEVGREIRAAFVPAAGMTLLSADYSQIELRIMAHLSGDAALVRAFEEDQDVHVATAAAVFGVAPEAVTADQRRSAKTVNFAVLYGQREFGLSRQLRIDSAQARELIQAYFQRFPGVVQALDQILAQARTQGYVSTLPPYRRRRHIPGIHAGNRNERQAAEREAINAPIQGTAADIIKSAMIRVDRALRAAELKSRMILQVHDELLFEAAAGEERELAALVRQQMEGAYPLNVPLKVDVRSGKNWRDLEPVVL